STSVSFSTQTAADGRYAFVLLPPAPFSFTATATQQGVAVHASVSTAVAAGQTSVADIAIDTIAPQVSITSPAPNLQVDPRSPLEVAVQAGDAGGVVAISLA